MYDYVPFHVYSAAHTRVSGHRHSTSPSTGSAVLSTGCVTRDLHRVAYLKGVRVCWKGWVWGYNTGRNMLFGHTVHYADMTFSVMCIFRTLKVPKKLVRMSSDIWIVCQGRFIHECVNTKGFGWHFIFPTCLVYSTVYSNGV